MDAIDVTKLQVARCPFCGTKPGFSTNRAGCRDEPYRIVTVRCMNQQCGVALHMSIPDSDKAEAEIRQIGKKHSLPHARACMVWAAPMLTERWNRRA